MVRGLLLILDYNYHGSASTAEKNKVLFTSKLSESSVALDNLHGQMNSLSLRLESSQETIRIRKLNPIVLKFNKLGIQYGCILWL